MLVAPGALNRSCVCRTLRRSGECKGCLCEQQAGITCHIGFSQLSTCLLQAKPRIIGGSPATPGDYPYLVDLDDVEGGHWCMGELVAPDLVLTAAHCQ